MPTNPFLNTLQALGLYKAVPAGSAMPQGFDGIPPEMVQAARAQSLTGVGGQLLAAGFARDPNARALALSGISDAADMSRPLYNMAQAKLMATPKPKDVRSDIQQVGDRLYLIDLDTGDTIRDLGPAPVKSGGDGMSINVNNYGPEDKKFDEGAGTAGAKREDELIGAANKAQQNLGKIALLQKISTNMEQGNFAEVKGQIVASLESFGANPDFIQQVTGLDPNLPANQQMFKQIVSGMMIDKIGPGGFPANNFSEGDRQYLEGTLPRISNQPWANKFILETMKRQEQLAIEKMDDWDNYVLAAEDAGQHPNYRRWEREWRKKVKDRNLFGDLQQQIDAMASGDPAHPANAPVAPANAPAVGGSVNVGGKVIQYKAIGQ